MPSTKLKQMMPVSCSYMPLINLRLLTDACHSFIKRPVKLPCHQSTRLQKYCMKPLQQSLFWFVFQCLHCLQLMADCMSRSHAHDRSLRLHSSLHFSPRNFKQTRDCWWQYRNRRVRLKILNKTKENTYLLLVNSFAGMQFV